jgi:hypothetical protein
MKLIDFYTLGGDLFVTDKGRNSLKKRIQVEFFSGIEYVS